MDWLQQLDVSLFRFINLTLRTGWLDAVMPFFNWNRLFAPFVALLVLLILIKGGARGRIFVAFLVLSVAMTDGVVCHSLKEAIGRLRPFNDIPDAHVLVRRGGNGSMPSSHAANWFAGMTVAFIYYRRGLVADPSAGAGGLLRARLQRRALSGRCPRGRADRNGHRGGHGVGDGQTLGHDRAQTLSSCMGQAAVVS